MSDQPKYSANFSGQFMGSQVAMGEGNTLKQRVDMTAGGRLTPDETAQLTGDLAALRERVIADVPAHRQEAAIKEISELEEAVLSDEPAEPGRLKRTYRWFLNNGPDLAEGIAALLLGPLVGKLVAGGTGAVAAALGAREDAHHHLAETEREAVSREE